MRFSVIYDGFLEACLFSKLGFIMGINPGTSLQTAFGFMQNKHNVVLSYFRNEIDTFQDFRRAVSMKFPSYN
jgi:hypothetical protein